MQFETEEQANIALEEGQKGIELNGKKIEVISH